MSHLDLCFGEEPGPDPKEDALVLLQGSHPAPEDGAPLSVTPLQLRLELNQRPLPPTQNITS